MQPSEPNRPYLLVVDDDAMIRLVLQQILSDEGFRVETAADGQAALDGLRHEDLLPCGILLDLNMPVMTGWEFRLEQKRDQRLMSVPVVVISADRSIEQQPFSIDAIDYFTKPIDYTRLISIVQRLCQHP